jgi:hypothetical protein
LEVATDVLTRFEQGAFLIDLAPIDDCWVAIAIVELGDPALGAGLSGAAAAAEERLGGKFPDYPWYEGTAEDLARDRIGAEADEAFEQGRETGLIEAVRLGRGTTAHPTEGSDDEPQPRR